MQHLLEQGIGTFVSTPSILLETGSVQLRFAAHMNVIAKAVACHATAAPRIAAPFEPCPDSPYLNL